MWRRPQNNPAIPVPTYYPDDGADSHLHSPRRKSYVGLGTACSGVPMSSISGTLTSQASFPHNFSTYQKSIRISSAGSVDPFSEAAYQDWVNSMGLHQKQQHQHVEPQTIWPSVIARNSSRQFTNDGVMPKLPAYLSPNLSQAIGTDLAGLSGPSLDEDSTMESLKVPTNTPTTAPSGTAIDSGQSSSCQDSCQSSADRVPCEGQFDYNFANSTISGELANTLTHSLLNQPHPLGTSQSAQPHQIPLPASEVRSRKENRHLTNAGAAQSPSSNPSPSVEAQIRKFSHTSNAFGVIGNDREYSGSRPPYSRRTSAGDFGVDMTNRATSNETYAGVAACRNITGSGSEQGTKRCRNFTPASAKAIDEEDEPRRVSPRLRVATTMHSDIGPQGQTRE